MGVVQGPAERMPVDSLRTQAVRRTAARLFEAGGYAGTTMTDIADAVGVLPGSLYHHFASKEQIAVDLLADFGRELAEVGRAAAATPPEPGAPAAHRVRQLTAEVMTVAVQHAAAIRLRAFEAPSVATSELRTAMQVDVTALQRAWRDAVGALRPPRPDRGLDRGLLRSALLQLSLGAPTNHPAGTDPHRAAAGLCDALLDGLAVDCPPDAALNASPAARAAEEAVARWRVDGQAAPANDRDVIVTAARREFARRGYDATTIRDVAAAAGVPMGTLYRRVESKEALLREVLGSYTDHLGDAFAAVLAAGSGELETLDGLGRVFVTASRRFDAESCIVRYGWSGRETAGNPFHAHFLATQQRLTALEGLLDRGLVTGELQVGPTVPGHAGAAVPELALHIRSVLWLPFHQHARTGVARAHAFVRATLLRGALRG